MHALVDAQIDARDRRRDSCQERIDERRAIADEREHRPVVVRIHVHVEHGRARPEGASIASTTERSRPSETLGTASSTIRTLRGPCPKTSLRPTDRRAGARSCACSPSFAPTASLVVSSLLAILSQIAGILVFVLTGIIINELDADPDTRLLVIEIAAIVGLGLVRGALQYGRRIISGRQALGVEYDLRDDLYSHFLRLSFGFYDRSQTGQLMSRATIDLQSVRFFSATG